MSKPSKTMRLSHQELLVCQRLIEAFPGIVEMDDIVERHHHTDTGAPGDATERPVTQVCRIRALLGRAAVETVWQTRLGPDGAVRPVRNRPCLGYRAGVGLAGAMQDLGYPVSPSSSESDSDAPATWKATPTASGHARRTWWASEPHRGSGLRVQSQLEASCLQAVGL